MRKVMPVEYDPMGGSNAQGFARIRQNAQIAQSTWHGTAFLVEALLLLAVLAGCIAVFMQLFAHAHKLGVENGELSQAIVAASNAAEQFSASPTTVPETTTVGEGYQVATTITPETASSGTLYRAHIVVTKAGEEVYTIDTARYVSASSSDSGAAAIGTAGEAAATAASGAAATSATSATSIQESGVE